MYRTPRLLATTALTCLLLACGDPGADGNARSSTGTSQATGLAGFADPSGDPSATMFQTLDGQALELSAFAGNKVFLNYWATWCAPCIREIPSIARAAEALESEGYVFLLASDESLDTISNFLDEREFTGNFIKLNGFFGGHGIDAVPSSLLYDAQGVLIGSWPGAFEWDSPEMLSALREAR